MKRVLWGDVSAAARVLLGEVPPLRRALARALLREAAAADRFRRAFGRSHPRFGDGSLQAAALRRDAAAERFLDDPDYLSCVLIVLEALRAAPPVMADVPPVAVPAPRVPLALT